MITLIVLGLITLMCVFLKRRLTYWRRQNVPFVPLKYPFIYGNISKGRHQALQFADFYERYRMQTFPFIGIYTMLDQPVVLIVDLNLIRKILRDDFRSFQSRGMFYNEKDDPLSAILGTLDYEQCKVIRAKLTPAFTLAKMRDMFDIMKQICDQLVDGLKSDVEINDQVEIRGLFGRYAVDVIGFTMLGLKFDCLNNPRTELQEMIEQAMQSHSKFPWNILKNAYPKFARFIRMRKHPKKVTDFFMDIIKQTIQYRTEHNERRSDYMQVLIDSGLTTNQIAALAFDFLSAGYADVTSTLSYALYELSLPENKEIQAKARHEIEDILQQDGGELTYDVLDKMEYCKLIINETLRKHPVAGTITRIATKAFKVPGTDYTIPKGMRIYIPTYALHHSSLYPNEDKFVPDRFSKDKSIPANAFLPFGDGLRKCIGYAFAKLLIHIAMVSLLQKFEFSTCERTQIPMEYSATKNTLIPKDGVWLSVRRV